MAIRSTICTLALIAAGAVSGCTSSDARFGIHAGADAASTTFTATYELPHGTVHYQPVPFLNESHVAEYS
jgi:hypothetical protein